MAIQVKRVPLARRVFGIALLYAMPSHFIAGAECGKRSLWTVNVSGIRHFNCGYISHGTGTAPVIAAIALFHLEFLRTHPGAIISAIFTYRMVQYATILL